MVRNTLRRTVLWAIGDLLKSKEETKKPSEEGAQLKRIADFAEAQVKKDQVSKETGCYQSLLGKKVRISMDLHLNGRPTNSEFTCTIGEVNGCVLLAKEVRFDKRCGENHDLYVNTQSCTFHWMSPAD